MPMRPAKGYNVEFAGLGEVLTRPVFIAEARVVATPLVGRLRLAGTLEFGTPVSAVSQTRIESIIGAGAANIVGVVRARPTGIWRGPRPVTTDGLPIIRRSSKDPRVVIATGHAMLGVTLAPLTAEWVRMLVTGTKCQSRSSLRPGRFKL